MHLAVSADRGPVASAFREGAVPASRTDPGACWAAGMPGEGMVMSLRVILAGLPRTGTASLKLALVRAMSTARMLRLVSVERDLCWRADPMPTCNVRLASRRGVSCRATREDVAMQPSGYKVAACPADRSPS